MKIPRLLQAVLVLAGVYFGFIIVFDYLLGCNYPQKPADNVYDFFVAAGVLMVFTYDEDNMRELVGSGKSTGRGSGKTRGPQYCVCLNSAARRLFGL